MGVGVGVGVVEVVVVAAAAVIAHCPVVVVIGPCASSSAAPDHHHDSPRAFSRPRCARPASLLPADSRCSSWVGPRQGSPAWSPKQQPKASRLLSSAPRGHHFVLDASLVLFLAFHVGHCLDQRERHGVEDGVLLRREYCPTCAKFVCMFYT